VAIYIGGGQYVAAPAPGKNVQIETVDEINFMPNFIGSYNI
ncbi:MAG: C40 family peptidase, partial [Weissella cibaria]